MVLHCLGRHVPRLRLARCPTRRLCVWASYTEDLPAGHHPRRPPVAAAGALRRRRDHREPDPVDFHRLDLTPHPPCAGGHWALPATNGPAGGHPVKVLYLLVGRGGSKGVPGKNLANVGGRSLVAWKAL